MHLFMAESKIVILMIITDFLSHILNIIFKLSYINFDLKFVALKYLKYINTDAQ